MSRSDVPARFLDAGTLPGISRGSKNERGGRSIRDDRMESVGVPETRIN